GRWWERAPPREGALRASSELDPCWSDAGDGGVEAQQVAGGRELLERRLVHVLGGGGDVGGLQVLAAERHLGDVAGGHGDRGDELAVGREPRDLGTEVEAGPDVVFGIDDRAVRVGIGEQGLGVDERARLADAGRREVGDHDLLTAGVGKVDPVTRAADGGAVGNGDARGAGWADLAAVEEVEAAAGGGFGVVHRAEPDAAPGVGAGVVEAVAGGFAGDGRQLRELLVGGIERVEPVLEAAEQEVVFGRKRPADLLGRFGDGIAAGRRIVVPEAVSLDVDEPDHGALRVPQDAFAELAFGFENAVNVRLYLHPASTQ